MAPVREGEDDPVVGCGPIGFRNLNDGPAPLNRPWRPALEVAEPDRGPLPSESALLIGCGRSVRVALMGRAWLKPPVSYIIVSRVMGAVTSSDGG